MASEMTPARRKRVNRLKKLLLFGMPLLALVFLSVSVVLTVFLVKEYRRADRYKTESKAYQSALSGAIDESDRMRRLLDFSSLRTGDEEEVLTVPETPPEAPEEEAEIPEETVAGTTRKVYLTFDDGPGIYTDEILDILAEYDVKATFFVVGNGKEDFAPQMQRIVAEGHSLGMHSYSHVYRDIYGSLAQFGTDLKALQDFVYESTGTKSNLYRFPGGSSNNIASAEQMEQYIAYLKALGIEYYDWNVSSGDAVSGGLSAAEISGRVLNQVRGVDSYIVLMHDAGDKHSTVTALRTILPALKAMENTEILPITEETIPVHHVELAN